MVRQVSKELGRIDVLVNAPPIASDFLDKPATKISDAEWSKVIGRTLGATFFACRAVGRAMLKEARDGQINGRIINVASVLSEQGLTNAAAYSAAQGGILNLTRALAVELGPSGVRVNCLIPGTTLSERVQKIHDARPDYAESKLPRIPVRRFAEAEEMADLAAFMVSKVMAPQVTSVTSLPSRSM